MRLAVLFSTVFAPELFVLTTTLLILGYELRRAGWRWNGLAARGAVVGVAWVVAFTVYQGGPLLIAGSVPGGDDFFASSGLIVGFATIGGVWRRQGFGRLMPAYCLLLIVTSAIHIVVVPIWDISSHVVYATVSAAYLVPVDRRLAVLFVVPVGLVWSRVALDAHTLGEALGGLTVAALIVAVAIRYGHIADSGTACFQ